jgi:hypothetical protein
MGLILTDYTTIAPFWEIKHKPGSRSFSIVAEEAWDTPLQPPADGCDSSESGSGIGPRQPYHPDFITQVPRRSRGGSPEKWGASSQSSRTSSAVLLAQEAFPLMLHAQDNPFMQTPIHEWR